MEELSGVKTKRGRVRDTFNKVVAMIVAFVTKVF